MRVNWKKKDSLMKFFLNCSSCDLNIERSIEEFIDQELKEILNIKADKIKNAFKKGNIKFCEANGIPYLQFRKDVEKIESGTLIYFGENIEVIRGFPKIRRTLMLSPTLKDHFEDEVAVEEKMNGYNVRIASLDDEIVAFTRGGYVCPYTTKKALEILKLTDFFKDNPHLVICGEMVGTKNPYVSHYYQEIGDLGFRIFDLREKLSNNPLSIKEKMKILKKYNLPPVRLFGVYKLDESSKIIKDLVRRLGEEGREGVVIKDPKMETPPLKYTSSQAHDKELHYAFTFPFDFGRPFFFSRVVREGFQAFEFSETDDELKERAHRLGESILFPMLKTIKHVSKKRIAGEDLTIEVEDYEEVFYWHRFGSIPLIRGNGRSSGYP